MELIKNIFSWKAFVAIIPLVFVYQIAMIFDDFISQQGYDGNAHKEAYMSYTTYFFLVKVICGLIIAAAFLLPLEKWPGMGDAKAIRPEDQDNVTLTNCHMLVVGGLYIALILLTMILNIGMPSTTSI
ncbi:MAG: hypothetical protein FJX23_08575 [Alphaproteobacteria bacterium]|nr:hypothetical protein [Alphaproteobacteria bacterium]